MKILITGGGTSEKIDDVRTITNTGTGMLSSLIAERFLESPAVDTLYYVCNRKAIQPDLAQYPDNLKITYADDTLSLESAINKICGSGEIDAVVHCMAVSDYRVRTVSTAHYLAEKIGAQIAQAQDHHNSEEQKIDILEELITSMPSIASSGKLSSKHDNLLVLMEKTPKIISHLRPLLPDAIIVGFKLLSGSDEDKLIDTAYALLESNDLDYVLGNDKSCTSYDEHKGYLIGKDKDYAVLTGKEEIATAIAEAVLSSKK
jgi:phosphopantothenate-cysteine ligase